MLIALAMLAAPMTYGPLPDPDPEPCRMCVCNDTYDVCIADWREDYEAGLIDGDEALARYQACTEWLIECQQLAEFLDGIEDTFPLLPSVIFPPPWPYDD